MGADAEKRSSIQASTVPRARQRPLPLLPAPPRCRSPNRPRSSHQLRGNLLRKSSGQWSIEDVRIARGPTVSRTPEASRRVAGGRRDHRHVGPNHPSIPEGSRHLSAPLRLCGRIRCGKRARPRRGRWLWDGITGGRETAGYIPGRRRRPGRWGYRRGGGSRTVREHGVYGHQTG